jgi:signal transduction histidine kinase
VSGLFFIAGCVALTALGAVLRLQRRLELVARAEHELRGPATAFLLAVERLRRDPPARRHVAALESELERLRIGLADLSAARRGRRASPRPAPLDLERLVRSAVGAWCDGAEGPDGPASVRWQAPAGVAADPGRAAQALGNLLANAAQHGVGPTELVAKRAPAGITIEVTSGRPAGARGGAKRAERGRGLSIAAAAARDLGGRLEVEREEDRFTARLELPLGDRIDHGARASV